ncbi:WXG100 family type VII secretion target [Actinokineospora iranica]|uniref:PPE family protein n=1 Tax=Actinokineospora iranica TaxID=1271860 RepID=A0A1G6LZ59_9PSEU|nr:hypothetical protein [Actinokineospora iranica]SDC48501.1 hypothetical protein SAMN05216174_102304 [Actinokineospora iranica]
MTENDIVRDARAETTAEKTPVKAFLEGAGLLQDVVGGVETIASGDWAGGLADFAAGSFDIKGVMQDPLGSALSMGFGWLLEHIPLLKDLLDQLAGNQNELELTVKTWEQISKQVQATAEELTDSLNGNCASWEGPAADQYRVWAQDQLNVYVALSDAATGVAFAVDLSKALLNAVRGFVRGLIADVLAKLVSILCRYVPPAYPVAMAAEGFPLIIKNTMAATKLVRALVDAFGRLGKHLGKLGELLTKATKYLNRGIHAVDIAWRRGVRPEAARVLGLGPKKIATELGVRLGTEVVKETIKYAGPRTANDTVATAGESTDPDKQVDWGETAAKEHRDYQETRVTTETGGLRITGEL